MGFLCSWDATRTMDKIRENLKLTVNGRVRALTWEDRGQRYWIDVSRRDQNDGGIVGRIFRDIPGTEQPDGSGQCVQVGRFRIDGDGKVVRGPKALRKAAGQES